LVKIGDFLLAADADFATRRLQFAEDEFEKGGFADAVGAD
jgi:hypothetical protein